MLYNMDVIDPQPILFDWDVEGNDRGSFDDSDRFEEDSLCSWLSEPESLVNNWRGWKKQFTCGQGSGSKTYSASANINRTSISSLVELSAQAVAYYIPFEIVEQFYPTIPEQLQLRIAFWSFPESEEDIRLYSCLANGSADEFGKGETLFKQRAVKDALQIGFHLSASVLIGPPKQGNIIQNYNSVAIVFDRKRITQCTCTCNSTASWCNHIVALCLHRIHLAENVCLRAPVSESLSRLHRDQLQKFAQYLISELPQQILPTAQRLLDELLSCQNTAINNVRGAPDPTAGPSATDATRWCLDDNTLHENIRKTLGKFCLPSPVVFSDVNYLSSSAPPAAAEWQSLLRPLRGREPEGMWNLLSIIREMFKRNDNNSVILLEIVTEEILITDQLILWWFTTKVSASHCAQGVINPSTTPHNRNGGGNAGTSQNSPYAGASLCDEIVQLWRLAAMKPGLDICHRRELASQLQAWHIRCIERVKKNKATTGGSNLRKLDMELFPGFKPAIEATQLDWKNFSLPLSASNCRSQPWKLSRHISVSPQHNLNLLMPIKKVRHKSIPDSGSSSSEGFCENDTISAKFTINDKNTDNTLDKNVKQHDTDYKYVNDTGQSSVDDNHFDDGIDEEDDLSSIYVYDQQQVKFLSSIQKKPSLNEEINYFAGIRKLESEQEVFYARTESLYAHGFSKEACVVAKQLAKNMLANPPVCNPDNSNNGDGQTLTIDQQTLKKKRSVGPAASFNMCSYASTTLAKASFLCTILLDDSECCPLAFDLGLFALEMFRSAACNKALEVKLAHQETELVTLLKKIPLGEIELKKIEDRAIQLRDGTLKSRGDAMLPLSLASFIFDSLCLTSSTISSNEQLGFDAAVAALGMKANISEAEHALLCEGTRRQRGELAVSMLLYYKDNQEKLDKILDKLLDKTMHPSFKVTSLSSYMTTSHKKFNPSNYTQVRPVVINNNNSKLEDKVDDYLERQLSELSTAEDDEQDTRERWAALRCIPFKNLPKNKSVGMAAVDSSAPETTSSDNSPTVSRRQPNWPKVSSPPSDSGSSGSDGSCKIVAGASSVDRESPFHVQQQHQQRPYSFRYNNNSANNPVVVSPGSKLSVTTRFGKMKRITPTVPNQPSEACAHFMFELAKTVLNKAGGSSSTSLFTPQSVAAQNAPTSTGPHRNLHVCSFLIGLYSLGIHNCVTPNWLSRTYSSHVSWITGQAMEIGAVAINILIGTWERHLTPPEVATLADRSSRGRDPSTVRAAAELALSCLPHAHALNPNEIQRALVQCKEQSVCMIEAACHAVESAAKGGGVYPEVLFDVAKRWYELYEDSTHRYNTPATSHQIQQQAISGSGINIGEIIDDQNGLPIHLINSHSVPTSACQYSANGVVVGQLTNNQQMIYANQPQSSAYITAFNQYPYMGAPPPQVSTATAYIPNFQYQTGGIQAPTYYFPPTHHPQAFLQPPPRQAIILPNLPTLDHPQQPPPTQHHHHHHHHHPNLSEMSATQSLNYFLSAYRVGMLALETLSRRVQDDRPQCKYARNPPYGEDVKWLLHVALRLGSSYVQQYCANVINAVLSPFILYDVTTEAARFLARGNPVHFQQHLRAPMLNSVLNKSQQMFIQSVHYKLHHLQPADHDELIGIVCAAQHAFLLTPGGLVQFQEMLQSMRRLKSCKKDLWQRIVTTLNGASTI